MSERDNIFPTSEEALAAMRTGLSRFGPQKQLFPELCPLILREDSAVVKDAHQEGVWAAGSADHRLRNPAEKRGAQVDEKAGHTRQKLCFRSLDI